MMVAIVSVSLVSCGGDDDDNEANGNGTNGNGTEKSEAQKFVGCWVADNEDNKWMFFPDNSCTFINTDGTGWEVWRYSGRWSYDEKSKMLTASTSEERISCLINYSSDYTWTGIDMGGNSTVAFSRDDMGTVREYLNGKIWKGANGSIKVTSNSLYTGTNYNGKWHNIVWCLNGWESDSAFPECKSPSAYYKDGEYRASGVYWEVEVERCINVSDAKFDSSTSVTLDVTIDDDYFYCNGYYGYKNFLRRDNIFKGKIFIDNMYSSKAKLEIMGTIGSGRLEREYTLN